jgi:hypothetical protein
MDPLEEDGTMSRGPGRVERAIQQVFKENPTRTFGIYDLCAVAYPGITPEKWHKISVLRAVRRIAPSTDFLPYRNKAGIFYFNALDRRARGIAVLRSWGCGSHEEIDLIYDEKTTPIVAGSARHRNRPRRI